LISYVFNLQHEICAFNFNRALFLDFAVFNLIMKKNNLHAHSIEAALQFPLPKRILTLAKNCLNEEEAYAADELVELSEEHLNQLALIGIDSYIKRSVHKDAYNYLLLLLLNSWGHDYMLVNCIDGQPI
jgi:hypothetical protein